MTPTANKTFAVGVLSSLLVEGGVGKIDIFLVHAFFGSIDSLTKSLEVDDFPLPQESNDIVDIGVIGHTQNVVIGHPSLLLGGHIFRQVCDDIPLDADACGIPGGAGGGCGIYASGMIDKIGGEASVSQLLLGEVAGELVDDGADHLQVSQLLCSYRGSELTPLNVLSDCISCDMV